MELNGHVWVGTTKEYEVKETDILPLVVFGNIEESKYYSFWFEPMLPPSYLSSLSVWSKLKIENRYSAKRKI